VISSDNNFVLINTLSS